MKIRSRTAIGVAIGLALAVAPAAAAPPPPTSVPSAAAWLASQVGPSGSVESFGSPDAGATRQVALGLASARREDACFLRAMTWLEANVETAIGTPDSPGALGELLVLSAAAGEDPTDFGGVDLVARLGATQGSFEPGLYGAGDPTYDGVFRQGLALIGLTANGIPAPNPAVDWLIDQQCGAADVGATGGWMAYRSDLSQTCTAPDPVFFTGPDTNSTAVATEALAALGVAADDDPIAFLAAAQGSDGGFPFVSGGEVDPNSTALVIQALVASGEDIHSATWDTAGGDPMSSLASWQITTGPDAGALASPYSGGFADLYATRQAIWGLAEAPFPLLAAPGQVPDVVVVGHANTATVTWNTPVFDGGADITGYRIEAEPVAVPPGSPPPQGAPLLVASDVRSVTLVEADGTVLAVRVQATNAQGEGLPFVSQAVTLGGGVPTAPPLPVDLAVDGDTSLPASTSGSGLNSTFDRDDPACVDARCGAINGLARGRSTSASPSQADPLGAETATTAALTVGGPEDATETPASTRTGPDATGRPVPPTSQRAIDSAIWLWLLLLLFVAFVVVAIRWRRARDTVPLVDLGGRGNQAASKEESL